MSSRISPAVPAASSAQAPLRRLILYVLLFALVVIVATGLSDLLEHLFSRAAVLTSAALTDLARGLAFTLIGGPIAALLWWVVWRRLDDAAERASVGWGVYVTAVYAVSLIASASALLAMAVSFIGRVEVLWYSPLSTGLVWSAVWLWHHWMWRHPAKHPVTFHGVPTVIGSVFGLLLGIFAGIAALGDLLDVAIRGFVSLAPGAETWWQPVLRSLVWALGGSIIWWWHWFRAGGRRLRTALSNVALVAVGIFIAGITAVGGAGVALFTLLRTTFDRTDPVNEMLAPLGPAIAAAAIGALVWRYHRVIVAQRSVSTGYAATLVTSGVALAAAASGIGVIINATLALTVSPLAGGGARTLLLGGISSLVVGGPVWWRTWKPTRQPQTPDAVPPGRRVYLIAFFGISAVVALIALLIIGYRLFEFLLGDVSGGSLVDRIRGPLGLLIAAGLVAGYHLALWRRDRTILASASSAARRPIDKVTLVSGPGSHPEQLSRLIADWTGAKVTVWTRADSRETVPAELADRDDLAQRVRTALEGVTAGRVLVVIGADAGEATPIDVIPLE